MDISLHNTEPPANRRKIALLPAEAVRLIERARNVTSDRILRLPKLSDKTGRAPATIWKDVAEGILPPPFK